MNITTRYINESNVTLSWAKYGNGNPALEIKSAYGETLVRASVNPPEILPEGYICIKDWSENEGILDVLLDEGIISHPVRWIPSGYVNIPVCKILVSHAR
jgi:hypothetical protein